MNDKADWSWKVGVLNGLGECFWQESGGKIRKVSRIFQDGNGNVGLCKAIIGGVMPGIQEIPAMPIVVFGVGATDEQQKNCNSLWSSILTANPTNGAARFKLDK